MSVKTTKTKGALTMELTYRMQGDYLLPNLTVPENPKIGKFGMLRQTYLRKHHNGPYTGMLISGKLNAHLEEIDRQATEMLERLMTQQAKAQGVNESMKASDPMLWVARMNNIRSSAEETVMSELIYR